MHLADAFIRSEVQQKNKIAIYIAALVISNTVEVLVPQRKS